MVKAFNHLLPDIVASDPAVGGGLRALFYSGDDVAAKAKIGAMIARLGFFGINVGPLAVCSSLDPPLRRAARPLFCNPSISPSSAFCHSAALTGSQALSLAFCERPRLGPALNRRRRPQSSSGCRCGRRRVARGRSRGRTLRPLRRFRWRSRATAPGAAKRRSRRSRLSAAPSPSLARVSWHVLREDGQANELGCGLRPDHVL